MSELRGLFWSVWIGVIEGEAGLSIEVLLV